jgi:hypothetical protein
MALLEAPYLEIAHTLSQASREPMFVFTFHGRLFKLTERPPQFTPLFQLPPQMKAESIATLLVFARYGLLHHPTSADKPLFALSLVVGFISRPNILPNSSANFALVSKLWWARKPLSCA